MKQFWYNLKAWLGVYAPWGMPEPVERLTTEEALDLFQPEGEEEWESD